MTYSESRKAGAPIGSLEPVMAPTRIRPGIAVHQSADGLYAGRTWMRRVSAASCTSVVQRRGEEKTAKSVSINFSTFVDSTGTYAEN